MIEVLVADANLAIPRGFNKTLLIIKLLFKYYGKAILKEELASSTIPPKLSLSVPLFPCRNISSQ